MWFGGSDHVGREVVVPSGALGFAAHGVPSGFDAGDVRGRAAQRRGVPRSVPGAVAPPIPVHGRVRYPMQRVPDRPTAAHRMPEPLRGELGAHDVVADPRRRPGPGPAHSEHLSDGRRPGPAMPPPEPVDVVGDAGGAGPDGTSGSRPAPGRPDTASRPRTVPPGCLSVSARGPPPAAVTARAARPPANRGIARRRPAGSGALNGLGKASRPGMPCAGRMKPRGNPSPARPKRSMSARLPPPHGADGRPIVGIPSGSRSGALPRRGSATPSNI